MRQLGIDDPDDLQPPEADETGTAQGIQAVARLLCAGETIRDVDLPRIPAPASTAYLLTTIILSSIASS